MRMPFRRSKPEEGKKTEDTLARMERRVQRLSNKMDRIEALIQQSTGVRTEVSDVIQAPANVNPESDIATRMEWEIWNLQERMDGMIEGLVQQSTEAASATRAATSHAVQAPAGPVSPAPKPAPAVGPATAVEPVLPKPLPPAPLPASGGPEVKILRDLPAPMIRVGRGSFIGGELAMTLGNINIDLHMEVKGVTAHAAGGTHLQLAMPPGTESFKVRPQAVKEFKVFMSVDQAHGLLDPDDVRLEAIEIRLSMTPPPNTGFRVTEKVIRETVNNPHHITEKTFLYKEGGDFGLLGLDHHFEIPLPERLDFPPEKNPGADLKKNGDRWFLVQTCAIDGLQPIAVTANLVGYSASRLPVAVTINKQMTPVWRPLDGIDALRDTAEKIALVLRDGTKQYIDQCYRRLKALSRCDADQYIEQVLNPLLQDVGEYLYVFAQAVGLRQPKNQQGWTPDRAGTEHLYQAIRRQVTMINRCFQTETQWHLPDLDTGFAQASYKEEGKGRVSILRTDMSPISSVFWCTRIGKEKKEEGGTGEIIEKPEVMVW